jgi:hypothetical protein
MAAVTKSVFMRARRAVRVIPRQAGNRLPPSGPSPVRKIRKPLTRPVLVGKSLLWLIVGENIKKNG